MKQKSNVVTLSMGKHTANVFSQMAEDATQSVVPTVGMPVTQNYYTDRISATVTRVIDEKTIAVRDNKVKCLDYYKGEYEVLSVLEGEETIFVKRKNGRWVKKGENLWKGLGITLGSHRHWIDPSF